MLKKNALIFSILIAMLLGVLAGTVINKNYTSTFADIKQRVAVNNSSLPQKEQQFLIKQIDKDEKQQKREASSPFSLFLLGLPPSRCLRAAGPSCPRPQDDLHAQSLKQ